MFNFLLLHLFLYVFIIRICSQSWSIEDLLPYNRQWRRYS